MDISILHLSDLHIVNKNGTYSEVLEHLVTDIKMQCSFLNHIILVITGDIINKADYSKENKEITINFFKELQNAIGRKIVGVEIAPGNHDKEQSIINKSLVEEKRTSNVVANIDLKDWEYFLVPYKQYISLVNDIRNIFIKNSEKIVNSYYVESICEQNLKIIFINMDTSWSSYGGSNDKRNLCIDERQLNELKELYQKEKRDVISKYTRYITIMTAHHPLNWLKEIDESFVSPWLLDSEYFNIDFYLCGHTHDRQIKSFFDTYRSYVTLVTGIGWDEKTPKEEKDRHRYSIYNIDLQNNSCEIIIRKTQSDGKFDNDNDVLLSKEEKKDKRIYLPLDTLKTKPKIRIPIYMDEQIKNEYLFVDKHILEMIKRLSDILYEVSNHMAQFQSMHIKDFFIKYELLKPSKGTVAKQEIYDDYFYKGMESQKVNELFNQMKNPAIIYRNFISFLRELCGTLVNELKEGFENIEYIRLHFRKYCKLDEKNYYIAFCQAISEKVTPPEIRDILYDSSMIKLAFEENTSFVYNHNKIHNPLSMENTKYDNFITMAPKNIKNIYTITNNRKEISLPYLSASLSISCKNKSNILDILNYLDIGNFIFKLVFGYVTLFKINMEEFIKDEKPEEDLN